MRVVRCADNDTINLIVQVGEHFTKVFVLSCRWVNLVCITGAFIPTNACCGVFVTGRLATQTCRVGASNVDITGCSIIRVQ